jgi:hypothetical protein
MTTQMRSHVICSPDAPAGKIFLPTRRARPPSSRRVARRVLSWICAGLFVSILACPAGAQEAWSPFSRAPRDPIEQGRIDSANDPAEAINREIIKANKFFDDIILKPVARAYVEHVPGAASGHSQFHQQCRKAHRFANDVLQGNVELAWNTTQRFAVNTTIGVVGFVDGADKLGRPHHYADLGQTLGVWGIAPGPAPKTASGPESQPICRLRSGRFRLRHHDRLIQPDIRRRFRHGARGLSKLHPNLAGHALSFAFLRNSSFPRDGTETLRPC